MLTRRAAIFKIEEDNSTHFYMINNFLKAKYKIEGKIVIDTIKVGQQVKLISDIKSKTLHEKLFRALDNEAVNIKDPSMWMKNGNNSPLDEAKFCAIQDRNIFMGENAKCSHCNETRRLWIT